MVHIGALDNRRVSPRRAIQPEISPRSGCDASASRVSTAARPVGERIRPARAIARAFRVYASVTPPMPHRTPCHSGDKTCSRSSAYSSGTLWCEHGAGWEQCVPGNRLDILPARTSLHGCCFGHLRVHPRVVRILGVHTRACHGDHVAHSREEKLLKTQVRQVRPPWTVRVWHRYLQRGHRARVAPA